MAKPQPGSDFFDETPTIVWTLDGYKNPRILRLNDTYFWDFFEKNFFRAEISPKSKKMDFGFRRSKIVLFLARTHHIMKN